MGSRVCSHRHKGHGPSSFSVPFLEASWRTAWGLHPHLHTCQRSLQQGAQRQGASSISPSCSPAKRHQTNQGRFGPRLPGWANTEQPKAQPRPCPHLALPLVHPLPEQPPHP